MINRPKSSINHLSFLDGSSSDEQSADEENSLRPTNNPTVYRSIPTWKLSKPLNNDEFLFMRQLCLNGLHNLW